jgi:hypothetical protein
MTLAVQDRPGDFVNGFTIAFHPVYAGLIDYGKPPLQGSLWLTSSAALRKSNIPS